MVADAGHWEIDCVKGVWFNHVTYRCKKICAWTQDWRGKTGLDWSPNHQGRSDSGHGHGPAQWGYQGSWPRKRAIAGFASCGDVSFQLKLQKTSTVDLNWPKDENGVAKRWQEGRRSVVIWFVDMAWYGKIFMRVTTKKWTLVSETVTRQPGKAVDQWKISLQEGRTFITMIRSLRLPTTIIF